MKSYLITTTILTILLAGTAHAAPKQVSKSAAPAPAASEEFFFKPYVGADYQFTHMSYEFERVNGVDGDRVLNDSLHGGNVHVGARIHKHLGVEAGYLWTKQATKNNVLGSGLNSKVDVRGGTLDLLGYVPLDSKLELIGTIGVSHYKAHASGSALTRRVNDSETKARVGAGAQYWLNDNLNLRGIVRYQDADFSDSVKNAVTTNVGLNYQF